MGERRIIYDIVRSFGLAFKSMVLLFRSPNIMIYKVTIFQNDKASFLAVQIKYNGIVFRLMFT